MFFDVPLERVPFAGGIVFQVFLLAEYGFYETQEMARSIIKEVGIDLSEMTVSGDKKPLHHPIFAA